MLGTRFDRVERLRAHLIDTPASGAELTEVAAGDAAAVQSAWASFVPFLAHPETAAPAGAAMGLLDAAATAVAGRSPVAA